MGASLINSSVPPASQILDRLEYLINLVETGSSPSGHQSASQNIRHVIERSEHTPDGNESETHHTHFGSGQDVLDWPIFEGKYDRRWIEALIFDPTLPCNDLSLNEPCTSPRVTDDSIRDRFEDPRQASGLGVGVREDDVPHLVETFLVNVHVKNPIFDPDYLRKMAKDVAEHGFDWKPASCLVVRTVSHLTMHVVTTLTQLAIRLCIGFNIISIRSSSDLDIKQQSIWYRDQPL